MIEIIAKRLRVETSGPTLRAQAGDAVELVGADEGIHLGHLFADVAAVALDQASGDDQLLRAADFLVFGHFEDGIDGLLLSRIDEAAGVDHKHVGLVRMRRELVAARHKLAHHDLAIYQIFGTAQADKTDFQGVLPGRNLYSA